MAQDTPYPLQAHFVFVLTDWKENFCQLKLPHEPFSINRIRIPHGGMHAVLLDTVMRYAGIFTGDANAQRYKVTINLKVSFLAQSKDKIFFTEGWRIDGGRRNFFRPGQGQYGVSVATGTGTFRHR